jgi:hypothetical protein
MGNFLSSTVDELPGIAEAPRPLSESNMTAAVQHYLNELDVIRQEAPAEPIVRALLKRAITDQEASPPMR